MKIIKLFITQIFISAFIFTSLSQSPTISKSTFFGKSKSIKETTVVLPGIHNKEVQNEFRNHFSSPYKGINIPGKTADKPIIQESYGNKHLRGPQLNFAGVGNVNGLRPADPNGEVGPNHYFQTVNSSFAVWDKEGSLLFGPADNKTIWESLPGQWHDLFWGDPVIKYDHMADRWVLTSLSVAFFGPYYQMIAVSVSSDPLGEYYCYAFEFDIFNDYPKIAIWPDGYYLTYNMYEDFTPEGYSYSLITVIDRDAMLIGEQEITMIQYEIPDPDIERFFPMAADLRGVSPFPDEPCYIISIDNHNPSDPWELFLDIYKFQADWTEPQNSEFEIVSQFNLGVFEEFIPYGPGAPQKGSDINLMTIPLYMMYPVTFRQFDDHQSLVCCHTIWDGDIHYIKWYEFRKEEAGWYMNQTGNYAPEGLHYFVPSISINNNGDMAMGYVATSEDMYPSIRLTGRRATDPWGTMTYQEIELYKGMNYANTFFADYGQNMWGDYSAMIVDPSDDTTFWYTHMYPLATTEFGNWGTRIFSFNLSGETELPYAFAGNDTLTCNTPFFITQAYAEHYSSIIWTTSGDGNFIENNSLNATYLRGPGDIGNKQVTLTMHLTGYETGMEASDSLIVYLNKEPEVFAGNDVTINSTASVTLQGEVNFSYDYFWKTMGDGTFTDSTLLNAIYTPGPEDIINHDVSLVLTAKEVSPCSGIVEDSVKIFIMATGIDHAPDNKPAFNLFPNPTKGTITVQTKSPIKDVIIAEVIDINGAMLFYGKFYPADYQFETQFDLSYLKPGNYFIRLHTNDASETKKIILTK